MVLVVVTTAVVVGAELVSFAAEEVEDKVVVVVVTPEETTDVSVVVVVDDGTGQAGRVREVVSPSVRAIVVLFWAWTTLKNIPHTNSLLIDGAIVLCVRRLVGQRASDYDSDMG